MSLPQQKTSMHPLAYPAIPSQCKPGVPIPCPSGLEKVFPPECKVGCPFLLCTTENSITHPSAPQCRSLGVSPALSRTPPTLPRAFSPHGDSAVHGSPTQLFNAESGCHIKLHQLPPSYTQGFVMHLVFIAGQPNVQCVGRTLVLLTLSPSLWILSEKRHVVPTVLTAIPCFPSPMTSLNCMISKSTKQMKQAVSCPTSHGVCRASWVFFFNHLCLRSLHVILHSLLGTCIAFVLTHEQHGEAEDRFSHHQKFVTGVV